MYADAVFTDSSPALKSVLFFSKSLTPAALAATVGMKEEAFATIGAPADLRTTDLVYVSAPPSAVQANCCVVGARVTAAQTITLIFANLTAAANVPTAGVHHFIVVRP